jgi:ubiquinone/menaquinone biosynthesis C-methylase UbiE
MNAGSGTALDASAEHKARQVEMHRHLAAEYRVRYGAPFSACFQSFWNEELLDLLPERIEAPALDAGCGTGILLPDLVRRCDRVHGVDLSPDMLRQARERAPEVSELKEGDLEALPFPAGFFLTVVCRGSLHHAASRAKAIAEVHRVLAPGGLLALTEPSDDFPPVRWARSLLYRFSSKFDLHDRAFTRREMESLLSSAGFDVIRIKRFGYLSYLICGFPDVLPLIRFLPFKLPLTRLLVRFDRSVSGVPAVRDASFHIMALARKPLTPAVPRG